MNTLTKVMQGCTLPSLTESVTIFLTQAGKASSLVCERFQKLSNITLNSILQNYTQITVKKMAKMLGIS